MQIADLFVLICNCLDLELKGEARMKQITAEWKKKEIGRKIGYYFLFEYIDTAGLGLLQI